MLRYLRGRMKLNDGVVEPLFRERFGQELPQEFSTLLDKAVETAWPSARPTAGCLPWKDCSGARYCNTKSGSCPMGETAPVFCMPKVPTACRFVVYW